MTYLGDRRATSRSCASLLDDRSPKVRAGIDAIDGRSRSSATRSGRCSRCSPTTIDLYAVGDVMDDRGWNLNRNTDPRGLHLMLSPAHAAVADELLADLRDAVEHHGKSRGVERPLRLSRSMRGDDMILISVDDHICEPADMFDAHVPAKYRDHAPRVVTDENGFQQWWYGDKQGRNLGLNAVAGKPPEMFNVNPQRYDEMRPGLLRRARAGARHVGRRSARRAQLPELDRLLRPGAERGPRSRRQPRHDQGLQRLARRRVVRRAIPSGSSRAASCRCSTSTRRRPRCAASRPRAATR